MTDYMLRTIPYGRDLDQYIFQDLAHAVTWLTSNTEEGQAYLDTHYKVCLVQIHYGKYPCSHCGQVEAYPQIRGTLSVRTFLQQSLHAEKEPDHA